MEYNQDLHVKVCGAFVRGPDLLDGEEEDSRCVREEVDVEGL